MMSPVDNQAEDECTDDCWAHAATAVVECQLHIEFGNNLGINLDENDIVWNGLGYCLGDYPGLAFAYIEESKAISEIGNSPNLPGVKWGITESYYTAGINNIKAALEDGPVTASYLVYSDMWDFWEYNPTGVYREGGGSYNNYGHSVAIVSYDDDEEYWLCKNSMGDWADNGYIRIGFGECGIETLENYYVEVDESCLGKVVPDVFPSLSAAFNYSFETDEWACFNPTYTIPGTQYVPSGKKLLIYNDETLTLSNYHIISTGGTITVQSGATINDLRATLKNSSLQIKGLCGTIQGAITAAGALDEIYIEDGPFTENLSISGKDNLFISGGEINGSITATNSDGLHLRYIECSNLYLNNCEMPYLFNVHMLGSGSGTGIYVFNIGNSSIPKSTLVSYNFSTGLYAITSYFGIEAQSWLYDLSTAVSSNYSSNISLNGIELCGITGYHLAAYTNGYIIASGCYYDNGIPSIMESGGTVYCYTANTCPVYKRGNIAGSVESEIIPYPTEDEFGKINDHLNNLSNQIKSEFKEGSSFDKSKHKDEFLSINNQLKDYIKNNPESKQRGAAVTTAVHCYKAIEDYEAMKEFIEEIKDESDIGGYAERFMIDYYSEQKDFDKALSVADELLEKEKSDLTINVLYAKGLLLAHDMDKPKEAAVCFSQIVQDYQNDPMSEMAKNQLSILGVKAPEEKDNKTATKEDLELSSSNYPNPFNPTTKISFTLPQNGRVSLKVYDALGREVADLANDVYAAGTYEVEFDASDLASGIYFYTIKTAQGNITKKMLLVK